jgi:hypothetical protein
MVIRCNDYELKTAKTKKAGPSLPLPSSNQIQAYFLNILLSFSEWNGTKNSHRIFIDDSLDENHDSRL